MNSFSRLTNRLTILLVLLAAADARAAEPVELVSGVIVDTDAGQVYLMSPERAVEALAIADGQVLWTNTSISKPLTKTDNLLLAQTESTQQMNTLGFAVVDTDNRGDEVSTGSMALPTNVRASIDDSMTGRFSSRAVTVGQQAFVSWAWQELPRRGIIMVDDDASGDPSVSAQMPPAVPGVISLDLTTGRAEPIAQQDLTPAALQALGPQVTGPVIGPGEIRSADGRFILRSERVADDRQWEKYQWTIVDAASGDEAGKLNSHLSSAPFVVTDDGTLVIETGAYMLRAGREMQNEPRSIRAFNLASGDALWSRPLRDPAFRGPFPP